MNPKRFSVLIYLFLIFFTFIACDVKVSMYADVNLAENSGLTIFYIIPRISVIECMDDCMTRKRCRFINYMARGNTCFLLGVKDSASLNPDNALGKLTERPGYLFGEKSKWDLDLEDTEVCETCPNLGHCSTGSITSNDTTFISSECGTSGCGYPSLDDNSVVYGTQYVPSNSVKHLCRTDYIINITSTNIALCQENGTWTKTGFTCIYDCGTMEIENGQFAAVSGTIEGRKATISCHTGYRFSGSSLITCTDHGWDGSATCTLIYCGDPTPAYGTSDSNIYTNGSVITISCISGLIISGSSTISCMEDGIWSDSPTCVCPGNQQMYGMSCYEVVTTSRKWSDAKSSCESKGGHLADVKSSGEQAFIRSLIETTSNIGCCLWLGGNANNQEGQFRWSDNTKVSAGYQNWQPEQPDSSLESCMDLIISFNYRWNDNGCSKKFQSVCQIDF